MPAPPRPEKCFRFDVEEGDVVVVIVVVAVVAEAEAARRSWREATLPAPPREVWTREGMVVVCTGRIAGYWIEEVGCSDRSSREKRLQCSE